MRASEQQGCAPTIHPPAVVEGALAALSNAELRLLRQAKAQTGLKFKVLTYIQQAADWQWRRRSLCNPSFPEFLAIDTLEWKLARQTLTAWAVGIKSKRRIARVFDAIADAPGRTTRHTLPCGGSVASIRKARAAINFASGASHETAAEVRPLCAPIRVLLIGGTKLFRVGLRALTKQAAEIDIVGEGLTLAEAMQQAK